LFDADPQAVLKDLVDIALSISDLKNTVGRDAPTVITWSVLCNKSLTSAFIIN
jgi:hypothetical protein